MMTTTATALADLHTGWIALAAAVVSGFAVCATAWLLWRDASRTWRTQEAARALADVHLEALNERSLRTADLLVPVHDRSEQLTTSVEELRKSVEVATTLFTSIPRERARARQRILDALLPTDQEPPADDRR